MTPEVEVDVDVDEPSSDCDFHEEVKFGEQVVSLREWLAKLWSGQTKSKSKSEEIDRLQALPPTISIFQWPRQR